jgi:hypothetical protein
MGTGCSRPEARLWGDTATTGTGEPNNVPDPTAPCQIVLSDAGLNWQAVTPVIADDGGLVTDTGCIVYTSEIP